MRATWTDADGSSRFPKIPVRFFIPLIVLTLACVATEASAQPEWDPFVGRVVMNPSFYLTQPTETPGEPGTAALAGALESGALSQFQSDRERFEWVTSEQLVQTLESRATYKDTIELARGWIEIGLEHYRRLESGDAIEALEKALRLYRSIHYEYVQPQEVAEVLQYLALSHLEQRRDLIEPLEYLQDMIVLDPSRVFREGYYPEDVVRSFRSAKSTLESDLIDNGPELSRSRKLADLASADFVITPAFVVENDALTMVFFVYSEERDAFLDSERIALESLSTASVREASNRLTSRVMACLLEPEPIVTSTVPESTGESPWSVELNFAYAFFLTFPGVGVEPFGNYGASFGTRYLLTREFAFLANVQFLTSLRDRSGFLTNDGFTSLRGFAGISIGYTFGVFRPEIASLLEVSTVGDIGVCTDVSQIPSGCRDNVTFHEVGTLVGINVRPRVTLQVFKSLDYVVGASASFFLLPFSDRVVNFPITFETGLEYRF